MSAPSALERKPARSQLKPRPLHSAQNGHSYLEQAVYNLLWSDNGAANSKDEIRQARGGYNRIASKLHTDKKAVKRSLRSLSQSGRVEALAYRRRLQRARRRLSWGDARLPPRRAYRIRDSFASGLDNQVSTAGPERGGGNASARSDSGHLRATRGQDYEGACGQGPRAPVRFDSAAGDDRSPVAVVKREDGAPPDGGVSAHQEAVLGTALVGARVFLLQFRQRNRRGDREVHCRAKHRSGRRFPSRWLSPSTS